MSCGRGTKTRTIQCHLGDLILASSECDKSKEPETLTECYEQECGISEEESMWVTGQWSDCSKSCSGGNRERKVHCQINNEKVSNSKCSNDQKPDNIEKCNTDKCPEWKIGAWDECSKTCGSGTQYRLIHFLLTKFIICL